MVHVINHPETQNPSETPLHTHQDGFSQKDTVMSINQNVGTQEPSYTTSRNVKQHSCCGKQSDSYSNS